MLDILISTSPDAELLGEPKIDAVGEDDAELEAGINFLDGSRLEVRLAI